MRYHINADEVYDSKTNLIWRIEADPLRYRIDEALELTSDTIIETGLPWRLPRVDELSSLVDYTRAMPASSFPNIESDVYWTSSLTREPNPSLWVVNMTSGHILTYRAEGQRAKVILVRDNVNNRET